MWRMENHELKRYLLNKPFASVSQPFGEGIDVYKVKDKMFATLALGKMGQQSSGHWWVNLKCDPDEAAILRDIFEAVIPGYHMNKRHWNTVIVDGSCVLRGYYHKSSIILLLKSVWPFSPGGGGQEGT